MEHMYLPEQKARQMSDTQVHECINTGKRQNLQMKQTPASEQVVLGMGTAFIVLTPEKIIALWV